MKALAVHLHQLDRWDLKSAKAALFKAAHPDFVPLGNFVGERLELVRPFLEPEKEWPVHGVSNRDGVFLSHVQLGQDFKAPYKRIRKDWFFHNPTRANVGSMGRVGDVPEDALTSPEYQVWSVDDPTWSPDYVEILLKMPFFNLMVHVHRVGAVKERLYTRNLMEIPVPNRDPAFQAEVVDRWQQAAKRIAAYEATVEEHESSLVVEVLTHAGLEVYTPPPRGKSFALGLAMLDRWGAAFNRHVWTPENLISSRRYRCEPLGKIADINPPTLRAVAPEATVSFVPMEAVSEVSGTIERAEEIPFEEVGKGYTPFQEGDLIWAKITPCMQNGKSAVARELRNNLGFGSTEFYVIRPNDPDVVSVDYLWCLLRLKAVRDAAQRFFVGSAGQQRVPEDFLRNLWLPVPPPKVQQRIVTAVQDRRRVIAEERKAMEKFRSEQIAAIEAAILSGVLERAA
jgi:type I restriction enzyme S subunit